MFVRGGVYRVVKEALGGTLAKFSVSALMFDYILTGPISGVSAGQYLAGFLNELLRSAHVGITLPVNPGAAGFAILVTLYFWWENLKGIPQSSEKALRIMQFTSMMVVLLIGWCGYTLWVRGAHLPPPPTLGHLHFAPDALGWLSHSSLPHTIGLLGIFIALLVRSGAFSALFLASGFSLVALGIGSAGLWRKALQGGTQFSGGSLAMDIWKKWLSEQGYATLLFEEEYAKLKARG